jgi:hypothetical protein
MRLDHVGERIAGPLAFGEGLIGGQIDGNRLDGHALIMHLDPGSVKKTTNAAGVDVLESFHDRVVVLRDQELVVFVVPDAREMPGQRGVIFAPLSGNESHMNTMSRYESLHGKRHCNAMK